VTPSRPQHSRPRRDLVVWTGTLVVGAALLVVAVVFFVVGLFESNWPDRTTVWALALAAAASGTKLVVDAWADRPVGWRPPAHPHLRALTASRTWLGALCLVMTFGLAADASPSGILTVSGDLSLIVDEGEVSLVVSSERGVAFCTLAAGTWSGRWSSPRADPDWGEVGRSSAFEAWRGTLQLLGQRDGHLVQGRYDSGRWHGSYAVTLHERLVTGVRGRPAYFEHLAPDGRRWYLALVPDATGGVRLYWRRDWWRDRSDRIESRLGPVDAVAVVDAGGQGIQAVLRVQDRLYWLIIPPEEEPEAFAQAWTRAERVRDVSGTPVGVAGDPSLIRTAGISPSGDPPRYAIAVETADGLSLLTATDFTSNAWRVEQLPVVERTSSVALIDVTVDGRPSFLVTYRVGGVVYTTYRSDRRWHPPVPVRCGA
jgi:hypothetical protein